MNEKLYFVFDVESIGLYGEGFAAGYVVVSGDGKELESGYMACHPDCADGTDTDRDWIMANVFDNLPDDTCGCPRHVRHWLWECMQHWKKSGALVFADCAAPVEAKFLADRVRDTSSISPYDGPYPLHDVATVLLCAGLDPLKTYQRQPDELPAHNPLNDARQSARLLINALQALRGTNVDTGL